MSHSLLNGYTYLCILLSLSLNSLTVSLCLSIVKIQRHHADIHSDELKVASFYHRLIDLHCNISILHTCISPRTILCMHPANKRRRYNVTSSLIVWLHAQNDACFTTLLFVYSFNWRVGDIHKIITSARRMWLYMHLSYDDVMTRKCFPLYSDFF